jgi:hypothetical protein
MNASRLIEQRPRTLCHIRLCGCRALQKRPAAINYMIMRSIKPGTNSPLRMSSGRFDTCLVRSPTAATRRWPGGSTTQYTITWRHKAAISEAQSLQLSLCHPVRVFQKRFQTGLIPLGISPHEASEQRGGNACGCCNPELYSTNQAACSPASGLHAVGGRPTDEVTRKLNSTKRVDSSY